MLSDSDRKSFEKLIRKWFRRAGEHGQLVAHAYLEVANDLKKEIEKLTHEPYKQPPVVVCLCGSTRFSEAFQRANFEETLHGHIVLTIGCDMRSDGVLFATNSEQEREQIKSALDELHKRKVDLCDEILVLNVGGYIGDSTRSEIDYARDHGKRVRYLEPL